MRLSLLAVVSPALLCAASGALAQIQVVAASRDHVPAGSLSEVPGIPGARYTNFGAIYRSETGNTWNTIITIADPNDASTARDQVLLIADGQNERVAAREGVTQFAPGEFLDFSTNLPAARVNSVGQWAIVCGATNSQRVVRWNGVAFDVLARSGEAPAGAPYDASIQFWGSELRDAHISSTGNVGFVTTNALPVSPGGNELIMSSATQAPVVHIFSTVPTGQAGGATDFIADVDAGTFSEAGANWLFVGELDTVLTTQDKIMVRNGQVMLQEGSIIPGSNFTSPVSTISSAFHEPDGTWLARGANADGQTWVLMNGTVIARSGTPIFPGSSENWTSFIDMKADVHGNYVVVGNGNNPDPLINQVAVINNSRVLVRESEGVDFTGDSVPDFFLGTFRDRCTFATDGYFYFAFSLKTSATAIGNTPSNRTSLMRVRVATGCDSIDFNADGLFPDDNDLIDFLNVLAGGPCSNDPNCNDIDFNNDGLFPYDNYLVVFLRVLSGGNC